MYNTLAERQRLGRLFCIYPVPFEVCESFLHHRFDEVAVALHFTQKHRAWIVAMQKSAARCSLVSDRSRPCAFSLTWVCVRTAATSFEVDPKKAVAGRSLRGENYLAEADPEVNSP